MTIGEWIFLVVLCVLFLVLVVPVLRSGSLFCARNYTGSTQSDGAKNSNLVAHKLLRENLNFAKKEICIVSGTLYPNVYDEQLANDVRERLTKKHHMRIRILVGPDIEYDAKSSENSFWKLYECGDFGERFQIRILKSYPEEHFRIMDSTGLFREEDHHREESNRSYHLTYSSFVNAPIYAKHFNEAWSMVDAARKPRFIQVAPETENGAKST